MLRLLPRLWTIFLPVLSVWSFMLLLAMSVILKGCADIDPPRAPTGLKIEEGNNTHEGVEDHDGRI